MRVTPYTSRCGWQGSTWAMARYYHDFCVVEKERYRAKLEVIGLRIEDDPYLPINAARFLPDMSLWPKIEYGHIFSYFVTRPGTYTQEQLLSWKQLDAYNYFANGYVRTVLCMIRGSGSSRFCLLKAKVNPSQKSADQAHEPWITAKPNGQIISAHCTCMAG